MRDVVFTSYFDRGNPEKERAGEAGRRKGSESREGDELDGESRDAYCAYSSLTEGPSHPIQSGGTVDSIN